MESELLDAAADLASIDAEELSGLGLISVDPADPLEGLFLEVSGRATSGSCGMRSSGPCCSAARPARGSGLRVRSDIQNGTAMSPGGERVMESLYYLRWRTRALAYMATSRIVPRVALD
jgi:hypothetical protein